MNLNVERVLTLLDQKGISLEEAKAQLGLGKEEEPKEKAHVELSKKEKESKSKAFRVYVNSGDGDIVNVTIPLPLAKLALSLKRSTIQRSIEKHDVDLDMIMAMIDSGEIGEIVNIESSDGDVVKITID